MSHSSVALLDSLMNSVSLRLVESELLFTAETEVSLKTSVIITMEPD